jgi:hypothetical protein
MPQIILAGVIAPLSGPAKWLASGLITAHWGEQALESLLPDADRQLLRLERDSLAGPLAAVAAHVVVFAGATFVTLWWRGRSRG